MSEPSVENKKVIRVNDIPITYCAGYENVKMNLNYIFFKDNEENNKIKII